MSDLRDAIRERLQLEDDHDSMSGKSFALTSPEQAQAALLAVVERHGSYDFSPDQDDGPGDYAWTPRCDCCGQEWPCPDLCAVAEGLGIEV